MLFGKWDPEGMEYIILIEEIISQWQYPVI